MRTPVGIECPFFYGDYFRGKNHEECRLLAQGPSRNEWKAELCKTCPVPAVKRANACPTLELTAVVSKGFLGVKKQVKISAFCTRSQTVVKSPEIGCGICHPLDDLFSGEAGKSK
jgi:hypothetical protein